jgi:PAS domain S-box-containing protein
MIEPHTFLDQVLPDPLSTSNALIEDLPIAIYTCDKDGYITYYNIAANELWGRKPIIGKDKWCGSWKIYLPDGVTPLPPDDCPMAITLKKGIAVVGEEIIIERPDGVRKNIIPYPKPLFDKAGKLSGAINMLMDITERKQDEEHKARLAAIVESSEDAIISKTLQGIITSWNTGAQQIFGYTAEEVIGKSITLLLPPDRLDEEPTILERLKRGERVEHFETTRVTKDGRLLDISLTISPIRNSNGIIIGASKIARDITEKKQILQLVKESELLFRTISNASPVGLWMTDTTAHNTFVNETWIEWTGISLQEQLERGWLDALVEEDREGVPERFVESMQKREKFTTEFRIKGKNGDVRWCLTEGYPYYDINGEFAGYAGSVTDITEIRKLEQRKDDFIKMASHELKTPITSIKGYVQLLLTIYDEMNEDKLQTSKPTIRSSLSTISKQVSKLTRLVSELLDLSRIETGKLELNEGEFDINLLVEESVQDVRQTTSQHALIIKSDFDGKLYGDKDRISQVLLNLLANAIKYSPGGEPIEVNVSGNKESVSISISDHGIGIDRKEHTKIFERFYRVEGKSEQTYPGFGIGLFIANEIVERHHGAITLQSEKGKGSVFTITLPVTHKSIHY